MNQAMSGDAMENVVLGGFELRRKIGEGGFGTVYLAEQRALGRAAVVKVMRSSLAARGESAERFVLEARLASRLDHPCAAHIYSCGAEPDGTLWIAMELVRGTPLDRLLQERGPLPIERVVPMLERLCDAVQAAHDQGIVHRDIKPANIMIQAKAGRLMPKLLDFGIAKLLVAEAVAAPAVRSKRITSSPMSPIEIERTTDAATTGDMKRTASTTNLTQAGQILGSPPYMSPEQWMDPTLVGPSSDQYALALLAFEALTGERACNGTSLSALAQQHIDQPLREHELVPAPVYAVLARAAAKESAQRFVDLGKFVAALRAAAGLAAEPDEEVPALAADLAASWMADAPQPIAESIVAISAARTSQRICERTRLVAGVVAHWLGVLAVACRSRTGQGDEAALAAVRELRRRTPSTSAWIDLVLATCKAEQPELWPIPELAAWAANAAAVAALRELSRDDAMVVDTDRTKERAHQQLALLTKVLGELGWLLDYPIGRHVDKGIELWMGARGEERVIRKTKLTGDGVVLLDADGSRVLQLAPVIEIAAPMAGESTELFMFAGPSRAGQPQFTALPRGFERDDLVEWQALGAHLLDSAAIVDAIAEDHSPYPGLRSFTTSDAGSFVGREHEIHELVNRLRTQSIVTIVGPSGAGKSSFLAAGLVPALPAGWRAITLRPGRAPMAALAAACERVEGSPYRDHRVEATSLLELVKNDHDNLVVIVDQAEELFTQLAPEVERLAFATAIAELVAHPRGHVVIGVRDDFMVRLEELAPWRGTIARNVQVLATPSRADLERIVTEPARRLGYDFEDAVLPSRMVDDVCDRPGALPLLSFAAAELWELRDRHFKQIMTAAYEQIGGVTGALVQHADGVIDHMSVSDRRLARLAFRRLLTAEGARVVHSRSELVSALGNDAAANRVVEQLLAARLVVSRDDDAGERVEIIHEALTRTWPRLGGWRREDESNTRLHEQLAAAAKHWSERSKSDGLLWSGAALAELTRWRVTDQGLTTIEREFADASARRATRSRRRKLVALGGAFAALSSTVVVLGVASHRIAKQREEAVQRVAAGFEERGRIAEVSGDHSRALVYLAQAARMGVHGLAHDVLVGQAAHALDSGERVDVQDVGITGAEWSATTIVTSHPELFKVELWDRASGKLRVATAGSLGTALDDGDMLVMTGEQIVRVAASGQRRWVVPDTATGGMRGIKVKGDLVVAHHGVKAVVLAAATGTELAAMTAAESIDRAAFSNDGQHIATTAGSKIQIWDTRGHLEATCAGTPSMQALTFAPDGRRVVGGSLEGVVNICEIATQTVTTVSGQLSRISAVSIDHSSSVLASASWDGTVRLWKLDTGAPLGVLVGHRGAVRSIEFSPSGTMIASGGEDAAIRLWDVESSIQLAALEGHTGLISALHWEGDTLESASEDKTIRHWNLARALRNSVAHPHAEDVFAVDVTADGNEVLTTAEDETEVASAAAWKFHDAIAGARHLTAAAWLPSHELAAGVGRTLWIGRTKIELASPIVTMASSSDFLVTASESGAVQRWSKEGTLLGETKLEYAPAFLRIDPTGNWIVACPSTRNPKGPVVVIASAAMSVVAKPLGTLSPTTRLSEVNIDRERLAIATDQQLHVFEVGTWKELRTIGTNHEVETFAMLSSGRIIVEYEDGALAVWDRDGHPVATLRGSGHADVLDVSFDEKLLAVGTTDGSIEIWDLEGNRMIETMRARGRIYAVKFSPDGSHVYSGGKDGRVASWSLDRTPRTADQLARFVECHVPLELAGETVVSRELDYADPSCR